MVDPSSRDGVALPPAGLGLTGGSVGQARTFGLDLGVAALSAWRTYGLILIPPRVDRVLQQLRPVPPGYPGRNDFMSDARTSPCGTP
jgi:hypothetical protein